MFLDQLQEEHEHVAQDAVVLDCLALVDLALDFDRPPPDFLGFLLEAPNPFLVLPQGFRHLGVLFGVFARLFEFPSELAHQLPGLGRQLLDLLLMLAELVAEFVDLVVAGARLHAKCRCYNYTAIR